MTAKEQLAKLLADRPGWHEFDGRWSRDDYSTPGELHTRRVIGAWPNDKVYARKTDRVGAMTDEATFNGGLAEAIAWAEAPRSEESIEHRAAITESRRHAERNKVDLAGLKGQRIESGRNGDDRPFEVIDFDGKKVRITVLGKGDVRIAHNRKTKTIHVERGQAAEPVVAGAIRALIAEPLATATTLFGRPE